jgi:hypothetical protein
VDARSWLSRPEAVADKYFFHQCVEYECACLAEGARGETAPEQESEQPEPELEVVAETGLKSDLAPEPQQPQLPAPELEPELTLDLESEPELESEPAPEPEAGSAELSAQASRMAELQAMSAEELDAHVPAPCFLLPC